LQYFLAITGAGAVEGSIKWWCRGHRAHHRYTDTDLDPYNAHRGLFWSHVGWMLVKPRRKPGTVDISDLLHDKVIQWQHRYYGLLAFIMAIGIPTFVPWYFWDDAPGGFLFAGFGRMMVVHHVRFLYLISIS
jgi:stearoyl-CoA desaturase (Delta-9 desaturase)